MKLCGGIGVLLLILSGCSTTHPDLFIDRELPVRGVYASGFKASVRG